MPRADALYIWERQARPGDGRDRRVRMPAPRGPWSWATPAPASRPCCASCTGFSPTTPRDASILGDSMDVSRVPRVARASGRRPSPRSTRRRSSASAPARRIPDASLVVTSRPWPRIDALTEHHPEPRAEPAGDRARPRVALGRADLPRAKPTGSSRARASITCSSSPAACRGSSPRRSLCTTSATAPMTADTAPSCAPSKSGSPTGSTRSPPSCGTRSRRSA